MSDEDTTAADLRALAERLLRKAEQQEAAAMSDEQLMDNFLGSITFEGPVPDWRLKPELGIEREDENAPDEYDDVD